MHQRKRSVDDNHSSTGYYVDGCLRKCRDRRRNPTPVLSKYTFVGGRRRNRRQDDKYYNYYVDVIDHKLAKIVVLIFSLSTLDALLTLILLNRGASELNPIIGYYLNLGNSYFFTFKLALTGLGLLTLLVHQNFVLVKKIIEGLCGFYLLLVTYQLTLLMFSA